jgi:hypothetical protein
VSLARVHAVMAAGVDQPQLLEQWMADAAQLRALGVAPEGFDLPALAKFAGLGVKVRHNPLRPMFPLGFRLMSVAAIEIDLFSAYALQRSREGRAFAVDMAQRARDLVAFVGGWQDPAIRAHTLLWDALRYELAVGQLRAPQPGTIGTPAASRAPRIRGDIALHELQSDPRVLAEVLHASAPDLEDVPLQPQAFCFWHPPERSENDADNIGDTSVIAVDALGHHLLSRIDGRRSAAALARELGGGRDAERAVSIGLDSLAAIGIVALPQRRARAACA